MRLEIAGSDSEVEVRDADTGQPIRGWVRVSVHFVPGNAYPVADIHYDAASLPLTVPVSSIVAEAAIPGPPPPELVPAGVADGPDVGDHDDDEP